MVYLLHFDKPFKHARHYLGFCENGHLEDRFNRHVNGNGAKLVKAVVQAGIEVQIVRVWEDGDRNFERQLKNRKKASALCPICRVKQSKGY